MVRRTISNQCLDLNYTCLGLVEADMKSGQSPECRSCRHRFLKSFHSEHTVSIYIHLTLEAQFGSSE